jgi:hypothetical protein
MLLLLLVCIYLIFTNSVEGRTKLILIVFCIVLGLYLFSKLNVFNSYDEFVSVPQSAKVSIDSITYDKLKKSEGQFTMSCWIYIDDWNYKYGEKKVIMQRSNENFINPVIELGEYKNDLKVTLNTYEDNVTNYKEAIANVIINNGNFTSTFDPNTNDHDCSNGKIIFCETADTDLNSCLSDKIKNTNLSCSEARQSETETIDNIPLQKWVNIITTISDRSIDTYINGKLVKTKTFSNAIDTTSFNNSDIEIVPNDGFGGFISKVRYYPYYISPQKAWDIYKEGFGDAFESALNRYNMSVSFYQDSIEQNKLFLF